MDFFDSPYYKYNKLMLSLAGLWPYQKNLSKNIIFVFSALGVTNFFVPQIINLYYKYRHDIDAVFSSLPFIIGCSILVMKTIILKIQSMKLKELLRQIKNHWGSLDSSDEIEILQKYAENGRQITLAYIICVVIPVCGYILWPLTAPLLDIIVPLNKSRTRVLVHPAEYFVDQQKYFYYIVTSQACSYFVGIMVVVGGDATFMMLIEHACGMFTLLCYRLENIWRESDTKMRKCELEETVHRYIIISCIQLHFKIKMFTDLLVSTYTTLLLYDIGPGIFYNSAVSALIVVYIDNKPLATKFALVAFAQSCRLFFNCWPGQRLIDHSAPICVSIYNAAWYKLPANTVKLLLFLMLKSQTPCMMTIANLYVVNLNSFGTVMKTSLSYCTIMASLHDI